MVDSITYIEVPDYHDME